MINIKVKDLIELLQKANPDAIFNVVDANSLVSDFEITASKGETSQFTEEIYLVLENNNG